MVILLVLLMMAVAGVLWVVGTSSGAAAGLRLAIGLTGAGQASGVQGSLWGGLQIAQLDYEHPRLDVHGSNLRLAVDWPQLKHGQLLVKEISADALHLDLRKDPETVEEPGPLTQPAWPELPLSFEVQKLHLGEFSLTQDGVAVPVQVADLSARLAGDAQQARLELDTLKVQGPDALALVSGTLQLGAQAPIAVDAAFKLDVTQGEYQAVLNLDAQGTLEDLAVSVVGEGEGMKVDAQARLAPFSATLPLTELTASLRGFNPGAWVPDMPPALLNLTASLKLDGALFAPVAAETAGAGPVPGVPPSPDTVPAPPTAAPSPAAPGVATPGAGLHAAAGVDADLITRLENLKAVLKVTIDEGSLWQRQALRGTVDARLENARLPQVQVDLALGRNTVRITGSLAGARDQLAFRLNIPQPAAIWPSLSGGGNLEGTLSGTIEQHELALTARIDLPASLRTRAASKPGPQIETVAAGQNVVVDDGGGAALDLPSILTQGPVNARLAVAGGWRRGANGQLGVGLPGWRGAVSRLEVRNPQASVVLGSPLAISVVPGAEGRPLQWMVGRTAVRVNLPQRRSFTLNHIESSNRDAQWRSAGRVDGLVPAWLVAQLPRSKNPLQVDVDWDMAMTSTLQGQVNLRRRSGDLMLPGEPPLALGLQTLRLQVQAQPANGTTSNIVLDAEIVGSRLGRISARGTTVATVRNGIPEVSAQQPIQIDTSLAIKDLSWVSAFAGDANDIGGALSGDVRITRTRGVWDANGQLSGSGLRVVRLDDGVRLLDGTLSARLANGRIVVDRLFFPAVIRSAPRDFRIQSWLKSHGSGGSVEASGSWSLADASGNARVTLTRFPVMQRADRFIAGSGTVNIEASPTRLQIEGNLTADVGWISLEGASDLPSLSSDVVIVRAGDASERSPALPLRLNLSVNLGESFYLRGMGLDTGLRGSINVRNLRSGLRANGQVTAHEGRFSIYGQTLVVRRGAVTFEGLLDDPLLDIIAVRPNLRIEAGVQVRGTARNPVITLVSYPDVPEVEKLSWLLLGRGPDASGADAGMLLSAAASLLSSEGSEPIYRQLGLDELGLRSGESGSVRGILPEQTVVNSINNTGTFESGTEFLVVGKRLSDALYLTFEQALSGRESVVRTSYRISNTLSASLQGGTVNGLRLVWSLVFDD